MRLGLPFVVLGLPLLLACGSSEEASVGPVDPGSKEAALAQLAVACTDSVDDVYRAEPPPEAWSSADRGTIVRCAYDRLVTVEEMRAAFVDNAYVDPGLTTAVHKLRVSYWTERAPGEPLLTSASFYLPITRKGEPSPLLVLAHGSVGVADKCAPSKESEDGFNKDWQVLTYTLAGDGWVSILPDGPGLGTEGAHAWGYSVDEGHTVLDGTRAARKLTKSGLLSAKNVILGHSIGGHAALSAHAYLHDYGTDGEVVATVAYVPIWLSSGAWGALLSTTGNALVNPTLLSVTMQYHYGHLAAYEGEAAATDAFLAEKAEAAKDVLEGGCWRDITGDNGPQTSLGASKGSELYLPEYVDEVGNCGLLDTCDTELAKRWKARWVTDRPAPVTDVPIVLWQGAKDDFIKPSYQQCGIDRLEGQNADLTVCVDPEGDHSSLIPNSAAWVRGFLAEKLLGEAAPAACPGIETISPDLKCGAPIPNSVDPNEP